MLQSLFSGIAGVNAQQNKLDVIGHNIANVSTVGYKSGAISFQEALSRTMMSARGTNGTFGGMNPAQLGLGVKTASITSNFAQGAVESTGMMTDMALIGDGFFVLSDGTNQYYTRAGAFQVDQDGNLLAQGGGMFVQGRLADASGNISSTTQLQNIQLPFGQKFPAKSTENVDFYCNLDKNASTTEEWLGNTRLRLKGEYSQETINLNTDLTHLEGFEAWDNPVITIEGTDRDGNAVSGTFTYGVDGTSIGSFVDTVNALFNSGNPDGATMALDNNGYLRFTANTSGENEFTINITTPDYEAPTSAVATTDNPYVAGGAAVTAETDLSAIDGVTIADGQTIDITGTAPDGTPVTGTFTYGADNDGTTVQALLSKIASTIPGAGVSLDANGNIVVTDEATGSGSQLNFSLVDGATNGATGFTVASTTVDGTDGTNISLPNLSRNIAGSTGSHTTTINVYDQLGEAHTLEVTFTQDSTPGSNLWTWNAVVDEGAVEATAGASGTISFNEDGSLNQFTYNNNATALTFNTPGAGETSIQLNAGETGGFAGITQFASTSTTVAIEQDGYTLGVLEDVTIDAGGIITGFFSNGQSRKVAQIATAKFTNNQGLVKEGNSMFRESAASGTAVVNWLDGNSSTMIQAGHLEASNVDLTREFTDMILAQRGLEANAKVVSTADRVLQTVINQLKRM